MDARRSLIAASVAGFTGVALGAFGSHALKGQLAPSLLNAWHTGVQYQFIHCLAILLVAALLSLRPQLPGLRLAALSFAVGILLFSGSLYLMAVTGISKFGIITPLGGISFMLGWLALLFASFKWPQVNT